MNNHSETVMSILAPQNTLKPGFPISEVAYDNQYEVKEMKIFVPIEIKYDKFNTAIITHKHTFSSSM